jgi:protein gp37
MGKDTAIAWTDHTWNPWQGCRKVSPGCRNCYMYREKKRYGQTPDVVVRSARPTFRAPLSKKWADPARVFVCSWSDFFIEEADPWRAEAWEIIRASPHLTFQILTKRPERIEKCLPPGALDNVWLGVSVEADSERHRIAPLLRARDRVPVLYVSAEPLIAPLDMWFFEYAALDWVIVGGESGQKCRPMETDWARSIVRWCQEIGVAPFVKQLGGYPDPRADMEDFPADLRVREFPRRLSPRHDETRTK